MAKPTREAFTSLRIDAQDAQSIVQFLATVSASSKGPMKTLAANLSKKLNRQLTELNAKRQEAQAESTFEEELGKLTVRVQASVEKVIASLKKGQMFSNTLPTLEAMEKVARAQEKIAYTALGKLRDKARPKDRFTVELPRDQFLKIATTTVDKIETLSQAFEKAPGKLVKVEKGLVGTEKREKMAVLCMKTASHQVRIYDEAFDPSDFWLTDVIAHLELADAFLRGTPSQIYSASSMDTVAREELSDSVWNLANDFDKLESQLGSPKPSRRPRR